MPLARCFVTADTAPSALAGRREAEERKAIEVQEEVNIFNAARRSTTACSLLVGAVVVGCVCKREVCKVLVVSSGEWRREVLNVNFRIFWRVCDVDCSLTDKLNATVAVTKKSDNNCIVKKHKHLN
jgi:hypothetical protein|tara:strand:+ start:60 stop:437 length:378 start_codon:yes stop_codon:yes gene_type:complete